MGITLKLGCEVFINPFVDKLISDKKLLLLNRANYILLELPYDSIPLYTFETIYKLQLQRISIIIAHPERNMNLLKDFSIFVNLLERGCMMQVDAGSIIGAYGKPVRDFAKSLLKLRMVHFIASDAHCSRDYDEWYIQSYKKVRRWTSDEYAEKLYFRNPGLIMENTRESIYEMI
jgi:protein-tyrosine phosphatase